MPRGTTITIHALPIEQLLFDGLPLEDFVTSIVTHYEALEEKTDQLQRIDTSEENTQRFHSMSTYTDMEAFWSLSQRVDL